MRTGDIVYHRPTGEEWLVAWADPHDGYMAPCGWPTCQARISDCEIIQRADDETCNRLIDELAKSDRTDAHRATAIRALTDGGHDA